jgi:hypothetical protein
LKKITPRNLFIVIVAVVILAIPTATKGGAQTVAFPDTKFAVISDTHYYDPSLGTSGSAYQKYIGTERKLIADSAEIVDFSIDRIASSGVKFVLVTGDLSKDGELVDHQRMAAYLSRLRKNGIKVYVIPGNHDINNPRSFRYNGGKAERVANITAEQFAKIYNDFGYGDAVMRDQSSLSYVAEPQKGLWIVALDSCRYGENEDGCAAQCGGEISGEKLAFLKKVLGRARSEHKAVIVMLHHGIVEHWNGQSKFNPNYLLDDCQSFGRSLLDIALRVSVAEAEKWYEEAKSEISDEFPSRIVNNLACCYAGLSLVNKLCEFLNITWAEVFPINKGACIRYLQNGVQEYLLDGGSNNKTIVEQTLEIMARMKLAPNQDYTFDKDGKVIGIRFCDVYDRYTKYRRDYAITGECLPYNQFLKQLRQSDFFLESNKTMRFGNETKKAWALDFSILKERCDVSGFEITDIEPL